MPQFRIYAGRSRHRAPGSDVPAAMRRPHLPFSTVFDRFRPLRIHVRRHLRRNCTTAAIAQKEASCAGLRARPCKRGRGSLSLASLPRGSCAIRTASVSQNCFTMFSLLHGPKL